MTLRYVTLTGADNMTNPEQLAAVSELYPLAEWAILSSDSRAGTPRYPTAEWIEKFLQVCPNVQRSLHLCGADVDAFLSMDPTIMKRAQRFNRVQLNFNHRRNPKSIPVIEAASREIPGTLILQHNSANASMFNSMQFPFAELLFDSSGGRGVSQEAWPQYLSGWQCGYAGGIGPDNIEAVLESLELVVGDSSYWIDMESKLRNAQDEFDLGFCNRILMEAYAYLNRQVQIAVDAEAAN